MKLKMYFAMLALSVCTLAFQSCDKDDDNMNAAPQELKTAFANKYPGFQPREWEMKGGYIVVDFYTSEGEAEAWFTADYTWVMTETDIRPAALSTLAPKVYEALQSSQYANWRIDDVDKLERPDMETVYVIEVEQGKQEIELYYSADGILLKEVAEGSGNQGGGSHTPSTSTLPAAIKSFIETRYANARIVEWERESNSIIEVDIIHDNISKDLKFTADSEWISTDWDINPRNLPQAVTAKLGTDYPQHHIDDAEYVETPNGDYYLVELESGNQEIKVRISADGTILQ